MGMSKLANGHVWQGFASSSMGKAHIDSGLPNQDCWFYHQETQFSVAVVCDGAGSAQFSEQGAKFFSQAVGDLLCQLIKQQIEPKQSVEQLKIQAWQHAIEQGLTNIRQQLASQLTSDTTLRDYHTTLTAIAILTNHLNSQQAILVQIGDSPLLTSQFLIDEQRIDYFNKLAVYGDDNKNEYVNETHFITQDNWQDFLRIEWLDITHIDLIAVMSDGCADLVFEGASVTPKIYRPFFGNLVFNLCQSPTDTQGNTIIEQAMSNPATYRLTGDDKTLIVLVKNPQTYQKLEPSIDDTPIAAGMSDASTLASTTPTNAASVWHMHNADQMPSTTSHALNTSPQAINSIRYEVDHLPPSEPIKQSSKERRNIALMAGTVVAIAAGTLGWMNKDKLLTGQQAVIGKSPTKSPTISQVVTSQPTAQQTLPLASPATAFALDVPVNVFQVGEQFDIQVLLGVPKTALTQYPLVSNMSKASNTQNFTIAKVINPNTPAFAFKKDKKDQSAFNHRSPATVQQNQIVGDWAINYQYHCRVIDDNTTAYQSLNIVLDKNYQYRLCHINFSEMQNKDFQPKFDATVTQVLFEKGFAPLFDSEFNMTKTVASTPQASTPQASTQVSGNHQGKALKETKAIIHYLPNHV